MTGGAKLITAEVTEDRPSLRAIFNVGAVKRSLLTDESFISLNVFNGTYIFNVKDLYTSPILTVPFVDIETTNAVIKLSGNWQVSTEDDVPAIRHVANSSTDTYLVTDNFTIANLNDAAPLIDFPFPNTLLRNYNGLTTNVPNIGSNVILLDTNMFLQSSNVLTI